MKIVDDNLVWMYEPSTIITGDTDSDYIKVVRCKDCKYRDRKTYINVVRRDLFFCNLHKEEVWATDFCSYGEREETE